MSKSDISLVTLRYLKSEDKILMIFQDGTEDSSLDSDEIESIKAEVECCPELNNEFMNGKDIYCYSIDDIYELNVEDDSFDELQDELMNVCTYMDTDFGWNLYFNEETAKKANDIIKRCIKYSIKS